MSQNSSNEIQNDQTEKVKSRRNRWRTWIVAMVLPVWVLVSFLLAQQLVVGVVSVLRSAQIPFERVNESVLTTILAALIYVLSIVLVIGVPRLLKRQQVTRREIGLSRLPIWKDIVAAPIGLVMYIIVSALLILLATSLVSSFDADQAQDTGFTGLSQNYEYILAFITLVVIAPIAEEILFRGYLFGKLRKIVPVWFAVVITSLLFGFIHGAWNLAIDTFALSVILCLLRLGTGSLWAPILLHMTKNGIAFYILFVSPLL